MEMLSRPNTDYLLETTLESLHTESAEWLKELDFWRDELVFFIRLLTRQELSKPFPPAEVAELEKRLIVLNTDKLDKVKTGVENHERLLANAFRNNSLSEEQVYRETHRILIHDMHALHEEIRKFKKTLFSFLENT